MLRRTVRRFQYSPYGGSAGGAGQAGGGGASDQVYGGSMQQPLQINSAYHLLRLLLKSVDLKVRSRHGKKFMRQRIIKQWRFYRKETNPLKQRFLLERAGSVLSALHMQSTSPTMDTGVDFDFTRGDTTTLGDRRVRSSQGMLEGDHK